MKISPSILSVYNTKLDESLENLESVKCEYLHIDVMDNIFVPNYTFDHQFVSLLKEKTNMILDVHLMINNPDADYLDYVKAGADYLTFHFEATSNPQNLINKIKSSGVKAGISLKPNTNVEELLPILSEVDLVLVMSVEPGFGGQAFKESALEKIAYLKSIRDKNNYHYLIEVDGGINNINAKKVKDAGCDIIVVGSYLMNRDNVIETFEMLKKI